MVVGGLAPLFCCVDGFIISRLYFLCHNFPKVSELNSKTDFWFTTVSDFTSRIESVSNGRTYTCYCSSDFTNLITNGGSSGTSRGIFSKNSNGTTDFLVLVMGNSNIIYSARLNNTGEGVTYNKTFSDDATIFVGTVIRSGDDLNDYKTPGIYRATSSGVTATLLNMPEIFSSGFTMLVFNMSITANIQVIFAGDKIYMRFSNTSGWQTWFKYSGTIISS